MYKAVRMNVKTCRIIKGSEWRIHDAVNVTAITTGHSKVWPDFHHHQTNQTRFEYRIQQTTRDRLTDLQTYTWHHIFTYEFTKFFMTGPANFAAAMMERFEGVLPEILLIPFV